MGQIEHPTVVSRAEWIKARIKLLEKEKEFTRSRDVLSAERRELPWVLVDKPYLFDAPEGQVTLADLFYGRSQLIVKHYMMAPGQQHHCVGCAFEVDHIEGALVHLENHDVSYVAVARATLPEIMAYKKRMGWRFRWVSSFASDFNYDFHASFTREQIASGKVFYNYAMQPVSIEDLSGRSVFYKNPEGRIFHTYSTFGRGAEELLSTYVCLDLTPKGRDETGPAHNLTDWVRLHDRYGKPGSVNPAGQYRPGEATESCCGSAGEQTR